MPLKSLNNRSSGPTDTVVSGKVIEYRTAKSAQIPVINANYRIYYYHYGANCGDWWAFWKSTNSNTLQGPLTMTLSDGTTTTTRGGSYQTSDNQAWLQANINLNNYADNIGGRIVIIMKSGLLWDGDVAWDGQFLTARNGVTVDFNPQQNMGNPSFKQFRYWQTPTTWAAASSNTNNLADVTQNYGSSIYGASGNGWTDVASGNQKIFHLDYGGTPSNTTGPGNAYDGYSTRYYLHVEASSGVTEGGGAGYPFFALHEWNTDYNLMTGAEI